ncbi:uncharacterized protein LOC143040157 [Oratosquilla oratoria]|uniref:uncharacterized protein LOC143040157 n=1 Tax=Oratosquilla oratoria TaxID=337810 RepID=UPI003F773BD8
MVEVRCLLFLQNLHTEVKTHDLKEIMKVFGPLWWCAVVKDSKGVSLRSAYVCFFEEEIVSRLAINIDGSLVYGQKVRARKLDLLPDKGLEVAVCKRFYVYVRNVDESIPYEELCEEMKHLFAKPSRSKVRFCLQGDKEGRRSGSCFLSFGCQEDAVRAISGRYELRGSRLEVMAASRRAANACHREV